MSVEIPSRQWMDMQGYIFCALEDPEGPSKQSWLKTLMRLPLLNHLSGNLPQKRYISPEDKLSYLGLTPDQIATARAPLRDSKPWKLMLPIYRPDLYNPVEAWRAVLGPIGLYPEAERDLQEFYGGFDPFENPNAPTGMSEQKRGELLAKYFNDSFNNYELPRENGLAIEKMGKEGKKLNLISSLVAYKVPALVYALVSRYQLWDYLSHEPITGFVRLRDDIPITFYKVMAAKVGLALARSLDPDEQQEIGEDDKLNGQWQAAVNRVKVLLNGADKRDPNQPPFKEQSPIHLLAMDQIDVFLMRKLTEDNKGLPEQAGIDEKFLRQSEKEWRRKLKFLIP